MPAPADDAARITPRRCFACLLSNPADADYADAHDCLDDEAEEAVDVD